MVVREYAEGNFGTTRNPIEIYERWVAISESEKITIVDEANRKVRVAAQQGRLGKGHGEPTVDIKKRDIPGAAGEQVMAKIMGWKWPIEMCDWEFDFPGRIEVRGTFHTDQRPHLVCFEGENLYKFIFLVVVTPDLSAGVIKGYYPSWECQQEQFRKPLNQLRPGSKPQFWVSQLFLYRDLCPFLYTNFASQNYGDKVTT